MELERFGGYVEIKADAETIKDLLEEWGEPRGLKLDSVSSQDIEQIQNVLRSIENERLNQPEGRLEGFFGNYHIKLKESIWTCTSIGAQLALALFLGPTGLWVVPAGAAFIQAVTKARDLITKLDYDEVPTCQAVLRAIQDKRAQNDKIDKVTLAEINAVFASDPTLLKPDNLEMMLQRLVLSKKVLEQFVVGKDTYYKPIL